MGKSRMDGKIKSFENKNETQLKSQETNDYKCYKPSVLCLIYVRYIINFSSYTVSSSRIYEWENENDRVQALIKLQFLQRW